MGGYVHVQLDRYIRGLEPIYFLRGFRAPTIVDPSFGYQHKKFRMIRMIIWQDDGVDSNCG